jgi:hypothetical protein
MVSADFGFVFKTGAFTPFPNFLLLVKTRAPSQRFWLMKLLSNCSPPSMISE